MLPAQWFVFVVVSLIIGALLTMLILLVGLAWLCASVLITAGHAIERVTMHPTILLVMRLRSLKREVKRLLKTSKQEAKSIKKLLLRLKSTN